ncbi:MAG: hypothetical protein HRU15_14360, partial [Planctomycetes bacterium]|nr:hypothetical protein [Planctomycetota bacterium]
MSDPVIIAIPPKGGSLTDVLEKLEQVGWLRQDLVHEIRRLIKADKRRVKLEEGLMHLWAVNGNETTACMRAADEAGHDLDDVDRALRRMRQYSDDAGQTQLLFTPKSGVDAILNAWRQEADALTREAAYTLHLELDLARHGKPSRIMFDHLEFEWNNQSGILVGTEHEVTPTYLRKHKRDISLTCYDAFHNTLLDALDTGNVRNWHELNDHLILANTDVRILGSLGLNDYLGHFVLAPQSHCEKLVLPLTERCWSAENDAKISLLQGKKVLIDAAYEAMYNQLLNPVANGIEFEASDGDIEQESIARSLPAVYIVRSGSTIASTPELCVVGEEIITSETIVAVNEERLDHNPGVGVMIESLAPIATDNSNVWRSQLAD